MGTGVLCFTKLSGTPLKVLTVKNVKLNVQNAFALRWITLSWVLTITSKSTYFWRLWDNAAIFLSLLSFLRIGVYVSMEKQYMANFAFVFYGFLVFGNMITTFFISCRISLLLERILQCLTVFCLTGFSKGMQNLAQHVLFHIYFCWGVCPLYRWAFA